MSWQPATEPACRERDVVPSCSLVIESRPRDIGDLEVRRVLPSVSRRMVGPFIFFDEMGPAELEPGHGLAVRPHPHIGLATLTYLFDGEILHRDSLGTLQPIRPGAVNWMVAGSGIVHSERSPEEARAGAAPLHGIQTWLALPDEHEDAEPSFEHHAADTLPELTPSPGVSLRLIAGHAYGQRAPVRVFSPTLYLHAELGAGATFELPTEHEERALYLVAGTLEVDGEPFGPGRMLVFTPGSTPRLRATAPARALIIGGAPLGSARHIWWNFVASSKERIEAAKRRWRDDQFPAVPGDDERIPLPAGP